MGTSTKYGCSATDVIQKTKESLMDSKSKELRTSCDIRL